MALLNNITNFFPSSFLNSNGLPHSLGEEFSLCENGNMVFHWADFFETCDVIKARMETDPELKADFDSREKGLARLSLIPVWIRTATKVHQTNMFEIYHKFIMDQSHFPGGVDPFGPQNISFISGTGPFKHMALAECFNASTYKDFVLVNLLNGKLAKRDFRIRLKSKILMEYGDQFEKAILIQLEQITTNGLLLSMDSNLLGSVSDIKGHVRLLLDTKCLENSLGKTESELSDHLGQYAFNLMYSSKKEDGIEVSLGDIKVQSSFDFLKNHKAFLFVPYSHLKKDHPAAFKVLTAFVEYSRELVRNHYETVLKQSA
jgi:hypothetical protein